MKWKHLLLVSFFLCYACESDQKSEPIRTGIYFDLVALLDQQVTLLEKQKPKLTKQLMVNGESETIIMDLDSASQWKEQLALFYQADINKLGLEEAYLTEELQTGENRKKIIDQAITAKALVRLIEYNYSNNELENIRILIKDENAVYEFDKELNLNFGKLDNVTIVSSFSISGNQDMLLKGALNYSVKAKIEPTL
ncbi:MAG: hypothetical protein ACJAXX_000081 [Roseivirga sp.]|jgi:hypothetical protein